MVEYIVRRLEARKSGATTFDVIHDAALAIERPILFSLLILVCAYIPLFTLERVERRLFTPMAFTICAALVGSLLFTMTVVPVLTTFLFRDKCKVWRNPLLGWLIKRYESHVRLSLRYPWLILAGGLAAVAGSFWLATHLGTQFLRNWTKGHVIRANLPPGVSLAKSAETASDMRAIIRQSRRSGWSARKAAAWIRARIRSVQPQRAVRGADPLFHMAERQGQTAACGRTVGQAAGPDSGGRLQLHAADYRHGDRIGDRLFGGPGGDRQRTGPRQAARAGKPDADADARHPGSADTAIEQEADQPQMRIEIDRAALARYALNVATCRISSSGHRRKAVTRNSKGNASSILRCATCPRPAPISGRWATSWCTRRMAAKCRSGSCLHRRGEWRQHDRAAREPAANHRPHQHPRARPGRIRGRSAAAFQENIVLPDGYKWRGAASSRIWTAPGGACG